MAKKKTAEKDGDERQRFILYGVTALVIILLIVFFIKISGPGALDSGDLGTGDAASSLNQREKIELTEVDIFPLQGKTSANLVLFGIGLGNTQEDVQIKLGLPDLQTTYPNSANWEYREGLHLDHVGLLIHFDSGVVTRITIKSPLNKYLIGETVIDHDKRAVYRLFGKPDELRLMTFFTQYNYYTKGFEVFMDGPKMNGFSLIPVQEDKARNTVIDPSIVLDE